LNAIIYKSTLKCKVNENSADLQEKYESFIPGLAWPPESWLHLVMTSGKKLSTFLYEMEMQWDSVCY